MRLHGCEAVGRDGMGMMSGGFHLDYMTIYHLIIRISVYRDLFPSCEGPSSILPYSLIGVHV